MISQRGRYPHVAETVYFVAEVYQKDYLHTASHATELHTGEIPNPFIYWGKNCKAVFGGIIQECFQQV